MFYRVPTCVKGDAVQKAKVEWAFFFCRLTDHGERVEYVSAEMHIVPFSPCTRVHQQQHSDSVHGATSLDPPGLPQPSWVPLVAWLICAMTAVREYSVTMWSATFCAALVGDAEGIARIPTDVGDGAAQEVKRVKM
jgi:hypothetical protein